MKEYVRFWKDKDGNILNKIAWQDKELEALKKVLSNKANLKEWIAKNFSPWEIWEFSEDEKNYWLDIYVHQQRANVSLNLRNSGEYTEVKIPLDELDILEE